jgi:tRNA-dihydrouridine synthase
MALGYDIAHDYGVDGIMIGRGIFGNPWLFNPNIKIEELDLKEQFNVLLEHVKLFESTYNGNKNFAIMRKFFNSYVSGCVGASQLRLNLMQTNNASEVEAIILRYRDKKGITRFREEFANKFYINM